MTAKPNIDRRKLRADKSKERIIEALIELIRAGDFAPRAEIIAERAHVGLRTVFRLFNDLQSLHAEIHQRTLERVAPIIAEPLTGETWPARLDQLIERRTRAFEEILPFKTAADALRYRYGLLQDEHRRLVAMQREMLAYVLPAELLADKDCLDALDLSCSIESWRRLRLDQGLSAEDATRIVRRTVWAVIREC